MIYNNYIDSIKLPAIIKITNNLYALKFEWMKVVSTNFTIKYLLDKGVLKQGSSVIDSSSGVFAYSLALACKYYKVKCIIVGTRTIDKELKRKLELLQAEVILVGDPSHPPHSSQFDRINYIKSFIERFPDTYWMRQYYDPVHRLGYKEVSNHIIENFPELKIVNLICGTGSGASSSGIKIGLLENGYECRLIAVDCFSSVNFHSSEISGGLIDAIGSLIKMDNLEEKYYNVVHYIDNTLAKQFAVNLFMSTGLYCGDSSGACYLAGLFESELNKNESFFFICADQGYRYVNTYSIIDHIDGTPMPKIINNFNDIENPWSRIILDK